MVGLQRGLNHLQIGQEGLRSGVGILGRDGVARGFAAGQRLQRGGQARVDAGQRAAVGLVLAVGIGVGRALGQRLHVGRHVDQHHRQRQLATQVMHLGQVVPQRHIGLAAQRVGQGVGRHVGVAVAVAPDPLAHAQETGHPVSRQFVFQFGVKLGNFAQESRFVVAQGVLDFVGDGELGEAQQARLPQLHDAGTQLRLVGGELARGECVFGRADGRRGGAGADFVALGQQVGDVCVRRPGCSCAAPLWGAL
jgi:hypothetical protein